MFVILRLARGVAVTCTSFTAFRTVVAGFLERLAEPIPRFSISAMYAPAARSRFGFLRVAIASLRSSSTRALCFNFAAAAAEVAVRSISRPWRCLNCDTDCLAREGLRLNGIAASGASLVSRFILCCRRSAVSVAERAKVGVRRIALRLEVTIAGPPSFLLTV